MAYNRRIWQDHVTEFSDRFREVNNGDGTISHIPVEGEVLQQGTPQNARNFNALEEISFANNIHAAEATRAILLHQRALKALDSESGEVTLTNTKKYPFNDSVKTVALKLAMDTTAYTVDTDVVSASGEVGHIIVSDKQKNGFKVAFTGSATTAKIRFFVKGGLY